jgi:hypothetical protein
MSYYYSIFNLVLESDQPLPYMRAISPTGRIDVRAQLAQVPQWLQAASSLEQSKWGQSVYEDATGRPLFEVFQLRRQQSSYFRLVYISGNEFIIDGDGKNIWRGAPFFATPEQSAPYLLGPLLAFAFRLRGIRCLHGSAIGFGTHAIAFVGEPHRGKSTTAAAFSQAGYPLLSDDLVTLIPSQEEYMVYPGYPGVRLWLDAAHVIVNSAESLPLAFPDQEKRYLDLAAVPRAFHASPLPLRQIYVLGDRTADSHAPYVQGLSGHAALMALLRNATASSLADKAMRARDLEVMGQIAARVPPRQLVPHADLARLPDLVKVVLEDLNERA